MEQANSRSMLALRLPDPRFSVDFANYAVDTKACATSRKYMQDLFPGQNKPLPPPKTETSHRRIVHAKTQRLLAEERSPPSRVLQIPDDKWDAHAIECMIMLDESPVCNSDRSSASFSSTKTSPTASCAPNATSSRAPSSSLETPIIANGLPKSARSFLHLPLSIVDQILSYVFVEERAVSITPYQSRVATQQRRRHRHGPNTVDLRSLMMHPALIVCKQVRELGLDVLYRDSLFLINLSEIGGNNFCSEKDIGKYWRCWTSSSPPQMVKSALARASNIRVQLPVPSVEATAVRSATKRKKVAHEETSAVIDSLRKITHLITSPGKTQTPSTERSRSASPAGPNILRRKLSFRSAKRPDSLEFVCRGDSPLIQPREPLSTLEVILTKKSADMAVHSQTLDMVAICSSIPVSGALEYHLELEGRRRLWAKRETGRWLGSEPDGNKLLRDLRALGHAPAKAKAAKSSEKVKQAYEQPQLCADVLHRERALPVQQPSSDRPSLEGQFQPRGVQETRPSNKGIVAKKIKDMENLSRIKILKSKKQPPTVEELQQIAADIRRGVY